MPLWKALASSTQLARKVLTMLYMKLKLRPPKELIRFTQQAELISLLVSSPPPRVPTLGPPGTTLALRPCGGPCWAGRQRVSAGVAEDSCLLSGRQSGTRAPGTVPLPGVGGGGLGLGGGGRASGSLLLRSLELALGRERR